MKFEFRELGAIRKAELELGDLTIVCGENNTGKTYVTYAVYGFLHAWHEDPRHYIRRAAKLPRRLVRSLAETGVATLGMKELEKERKEILSAFSRQYSGSIDEVFAGKEDFFQNTYIGVTADDTLKQPLQIADEDMPLSSGNVLAVKSIAGKNAVQFNLFTNKEDTEHRLSYRLEREIGGLLRKILSNGQIPKPFVASTERTGAAIFQKELDFASNRLVELLKDKANKDIPLRLLGSFSGDYSLPVRNNVDFIRELPGIAERKSALQEKHPNALGRFGEIIGGDYRVTRAGEIQYVPSKKKGIKLAMGESSSAVRALLDIGFYLRHIAQPGDILMVDEPELNLHPKNQRLIARLFAMLVNFGIKVFITTHSDYIVRELNTLIALKHRQGDERVAKIAEREGYQTDELLSSEQIRLYIAREGLLNLGGKRRTKGYTLVPAEVNDKTGITADTFDDTIDEMNRIQDEIIWGG